MKTNSSLYWVVGPWRGKLALAARPRGGDWLADEMAAWRRDGIDTVVSLLTPSEERDLELPQESKEVKSNGMSFVSFPIPDRDVPSSETAVRELLGTLDSLLSSGKNLALHCRQGIGRTGLIASCLLISKGRSSDSAMQEISNVRGMSIPETPQQRKWIERFASSLASSK